jgi:putative hemolysin
MDTVLINVALVLVFILIGGVFSASELALVSLRESQVQRIAGKGRRGARVAQLRQDPNRFLAAVQIGVTLAGFLSAAYGGSTLAVELTPVLARWGLPDGATATIALVVTTIAIAYLSLVLGELVPKRLALQKAESVSLVVAPSLNSIATIARPVIWLLSRSTDAVVRLLGLDPKAGAEEVSEEELRDLVGSHRDLGIVERQVLTDVFDNADRHLSEVMVPRTDVEFVDASLTLTDAADLLLDKPFSRYPVIRGSRDDVIGFIHVRDLFSAAHRTRRAGTDSAGDSDRTLETITRPITALPDSNTVLSSLTLLRSGTGHLALVVDEYGGTSGIVTLEDLIEELVGEIQDEYDAARAETGVPDHNRPQELDGRLHRDEVAERTGILLPEGRFETLGGFVTTQLAKIPDVGETFDALGHRFTVIEMDRLRPSRILISPGQPLPSDEGAV